MKKLFIVSFVYAPFQVQISVFSVWAIDDTQAEKLAKLYKSEGEEEKDWSEYDIETTQIDGVETKRRFQKFDSDQGWIGDGELPVEQIFHWSRG